MRKAKYFGIAIITVLALNSAYGQKLYKWVDAEGNVTYQDRPPPEGGELLRQYESAEPAEDQSGSLADTVRDNPVILYSVPVCDACDLTRSLLEKFRIPFEEKNANEGRDIQTELRDKAGQLSVPVVSIGDKVISGYSRSSIEDSLAAVGYPLDVEAADPKPALTPAQVQQQAAQAAAELVAESPPPVVEASTTDDDPDVVEEIPEDERIKIPYALE